MLFTPNAYLLFLCCLCLDYSLISKSVQNLFIKILICQLESIGALEQFLMKHKKDYVDLHRTTEQERDSIEHEVRVHTWCLCLPFFFCSLCYFKTWQLVIYSTCCDVGLLNIFILVVWCFIIKYILMRTNIYFGLQIG